MQNPYSSAYEVTLGAGFQGATYPAAIWKTFMTEATKGQKVIPLPPRADTGISEDLVPKPEPTSTPTPTADPDNPDQGPDESCGFVEPCDEDSNVSVDPNENDLPEDDTEEDGGFLGDQNGAGRATLPESSMPSRREQQ
jgi:membrane peptidoglycan carboxypeptidase